MDLLISVIPGLSLSCAIFLGYLTIKQFEVYRKTSYQRSKYISLFCFFTAIHALEPFLVQSRFFSADITNLTVGIAGSCLFISLYFYIRALSFFVAIPRWLYQPFQILSLLLAVIIFAGVPSYLFFNVDLYFNPTQPLNLSNYFTNSYTSRLGTPRAYLTVLMSISGLLVGVASLTLLRMVLRSSKDVFFLIGLFISFMGAFTENVLLAFTIDYFVPLVFLANVFEAFRMNTLANREYLLEQNDPLTPDEGKSIEKYQNSNLSESRVQELAKEVSDRLSDENLYLNPNLSSEDLARRVGIPSYQLSQVINIGLDTTFFELLSLYRIQEVKKRLKDTRFDDKTIIDIAYDSGFNSKSAFNTAFKKQTGLTPSQFRKL